MNAVTLLEADHAQVREWFSQFEKTKSKDEQQELANQICSALLVHMDIEEEIFYPAFLAATKDQDMHHAAVAAHATAKKFIAEIGGLSPASGFYYTKLHVLARVVQHHVRQEEQPGGMFDEAIRCKQMDLDILGDVLARRKRELMAATAVPLRQVVGQQ